MDPLFIVSLIVAVGVVSLIFAGFFFYREYAGSRNLDERLGRMAANRTPTLESSGILKEPMFPDDERSIVERILPSLPDLGRVFEQADLKISPSQFWLITAGITGLGALAPAIVRLPIITSILSGAICAFMPLGFVFFMRKRRLAKFGAQLCEGLELVARALRAGHSLAAGMHVVSEEMPDPIAKEFGRVWEEQNLGISIEQAMRNLAERVPNLDLRFFVTAVIIQRQTGGDLAEILDKIGYVIRERFKIMGMVKALTGEGRLSGVVLLALPFGLLLLMMQISPTYIRLLWTHPMGQKMSVFAIISMIFGALLIRKIVNIKV
ncbi:Bacterial type II secretion system protein F domain protein [Planctomycetes bacterium Pan216]|uniref:Bacterial type II secretion system protein F domain protein n=1 Tax=Kolteria novifilia TaxID=2527975 RepID=A0A518BC97_9BACT|nr:Bacterial type II secretion system protein F domain protein [Planctomycetes bacterium Pan216]